MLLVFLAVIAAALFSYFSVGFVLPVLLLVFIPQKPARNLSTDDVRRASNRTLRNSIRYARSSVPLLAAMVAVSVIAYQWLASSAEAMTFMLGLAVGSLFSLILIAGFYDLYRNEERKREEKRIRKRFYRD